MADGQEPGDDVDDGDGENFWKEKTWEDSKVAARLLGSAMRDPTVMRELIEAGVVANDFFAPSLRRAFEGMRDDFVNHGRCSESSTENYLDIVLSDPGQSKAVVDFCMKTQGVRRLDDISLLLDQMRDKIGRRRLEGLLLSVSQGTRGDTPLLELVTRARRQLEEISASASSKADGWTAAELADAGMQLAKGTLKFKRVPLYVPNVDAAIDGGARRGATTLVIAGTGTGKTTYGLHFGTNAAAEDHGVLYISLEDPQQTRKALNEMMTGHRFPIPPSASGLVWSEVTLGLGRLAGFKSFKLVFQQPLTAEAIIAKIHAYKRKHPLAMVIVDYVQRVKKSTRLGGVADVEHISEVLRMGAADEDVALVLLSQVSSAGRARLAEKNAGPLTAEDSAGGVQFANDAAAVVTIERKREEKDPRKANVSTVTLRKNRDGGEGAEGFMKWGRDTRRLTPCAKDGEAVVELPPDDELPFDRTDP